MTEQELNIAFEYFSNPIRYTYIEAEIKNTSQRTFESNYARLTNNYPLPNETYDSPYYVLPPDADKWGIELRIYFVADDNIPEFLDDISTVGGRPGYDLYNRRINNKELIEYLFSRGFVLGDQFPDRLH